MSEEIKKPASNTKDRWLKKEDVFAACDRVVARDERVTTNSIYDELGQRGGFQTIQKHIKAWELENVEQLEEIKNLPIVAEIPESMEEVGSNLLKTFWAEAKSKADSDLDVQREALKQAEATTNAKVDEISVFSDKQTETITILREQVAEIQSDLNNSSDEKSALENDLEKHRSQLSETEKERDLAHQEIKNLKDQLEKSGIENKSLKNSSDTEIKALRDEITALSKSHDEALEAAKNLSFKEIKVLTEQLGKAAGKVEQSELEIVEIKTQYKVEIVDLKEQLKAETLEVKKLEKSNTSLDKKVDKLEVTLDAAKISSDDLKDEIKTVRASEKEANKLAAVLEGELKALNAQRTKK